MLCRYGGCKTAPIFILVNEIHFPCQAFFKLYYSCVSFLSNSSFLFFEI